MSRPCENCGNDLNVCKNCDFYNSKFIEIPEGATNGDMIKAMFPMEVYYGKRAKDFYHFIEWNLSAWWNAPYKKGKNGMTREEAIKGLKKVKSIIGLSVSEKMSLDMAIKALEQEPCEDAISRQAVLDAIDAKAWGFCDYLIRNGRNDEQKPVSHFADNLCECVREELPPVNPQAKTGHWIFDEILDKHYYCSECKSMGVDYWDFCPYCGAKMVELQESENK